MGKEVLGFFFHLQFLFCELNQLSIDCMHNIGRKLFSSEVEYEASDFLLRSLQLFLEVLK